MSRTSYSPLPPPQLFRSSTSVSFWDTLVYNHQAITEIPIIEIASEVTKSDASAIPNSPVFPSRPSSSLFVESQSGLLHPLVELRGSSTSCDDELLSVLLGLDLSLCSDRLIDPLIYAHQNTREGTGFQCGLQFVCRGTSRL